MIFDNTYGIEIECYLPEGGSSGELSSAITRRLGNPVIAETYNHNTRPYWKIVADGSLGDYSRGIELVSPILRGPEGLDASDKVIGALSDYGCTVSRRCGLHVHVGVDYAEIDFFRNLYKLYATYESVIDAFMPPSRRDSTNTYCRSITHVALPRLDSASDLHSLLTLIGGGSSSARYFKLNLSAYQRHRTVEFRQHSGTLDADKAKHWTMFCLKMVEAAKAAHPTVAPTPRNIDATVTTAPAPQVNRAAWGTKIWLIGQLSLRDVGVNAAEAMQATGWRQMSIPPVLRQCGIEFTTRRTGRNVRYYARSTTSVTTTVATETATTTTTAPPTLAGLLELLGCDEAERQYFQRRTANLSGPVQWAA